jgi:hypothetical protein
MVPLTYILFGRRKSWGADRTATACSSESWRKDIGLRSPSSGSGVIYGSSEWYDESPSSPSLSPATKKRSHDELEKDIDELTPSASGFRVALRTPSWAIAADPTSGRGPSPRWLRKPASRLLACTDGVSSPEERSR